MSIFEDRKTAIIVVSVLIITFLLGGVTSYFTLGNKRTMLIEEEIANIKRQAVINVVESYGYSTEEFDKEYDSYYDSLKQAYVDREDISAIDDPNRLEKINVKYKTNVVKEYYRTNFYQNTLVDRLVNNREFTEEDYKSAEELYGEREDAINFYAYDLVWPEVTQKIKEEQDKIIKSYKK